MGQTFTKIKESGRAEANAYNEEGVPYTDQAVKANLSDHLIGGAEAINDVASSGFIAMLEELKEHRSKRHNDRRPVYRGMHDLGFFVARPVKRNEYAEVEDAMEPTGRNGRIWVLSACRVVRHLPSGIQ